MDFALDEKCNFVRRLIQEESVETLAKETEIPKATLLGWKERYEKAGRRALAAGDWTGSDLRRNEETVAFGNKLKLFRHLAGYESQAHLARLVGVKRTDMTDYELGRRKPEERICRELARRLFLNVKFLDSSIGGSMPDFAVFSMKIVLYSVRFPSGAKISKERFLDLLSFLLFDPKVDRIYASGDDYMLVLNKTYAFLRCQGPAGPSIAHLFKERKKTVTILPAKDAKSGMRIDEVIEHFLEAHRSAERVPLDIDSLVSDYVERCTVQTGPWDAEAKTKTMQGIYDLMKRHNITVKDLREAVAKQ